MYSLSDAFKLPLVGEVKKIVDVHPDIENTIIGGYVPYDVIDTYQRDKKVCESMRMYGSIHDGSSNQPSP